MEKNVDSKGRWRNRNVGFRVSEEEAKLLDDLVELSGLAKQDYILRRLLNREVVVQGNPKVFKALKHQMTQIYEELKRLEAVSDDNEELLIVVEMVATIMKGMGSGYDKKEKVAHNPAIGVAGEQPSYMCNKTIIAKENGSDNL